MNPYNPLVLDHFEHPRNGGRFEAGEGVVEGRAGRPDQGVAFVLSAQVAEGRVQALRFEAYGCPHCVAAGSWLTGRLVGSTRAELAAWRWREAAEALAVPTEKRGRLLILEDAVRALAEAWVATGLP